MIDLSKVKVDFEYTSIYNFRPEEGYGMGKESIIHSGTAYLVDFIRILEDNSSLKHDSANEYNYVPEEPIHREDWVAWIGQPMFKLVDIKIKIKQTP